MSLSKIIIYHKLLNLNYKKQYIYDKSFANLHFSDKLIFKGVLKKINL